MEFRYKYGVLGAGAVAKSLIGQIPSKTREIGPVSAVSYRLASRIANALRAGRPVRTANELDRAAVVLFHAPPEQTEMLMKLLKNAEIQWESKALIFCDCDVSPEAKAYFEAKGASTAVARRFGIPGRIAIAGRGAAIAEAHRMARALRLRAVQISPESLDIFDAAITLGHAAITPLIDCAASLLRTAGIRDAEASRIASALFLQTAQDYARSGKQSWAWYIRKPDADRLRRQIAAAGAPVEPMLRALLVFGLKIFEKYPETAGLLVKTFITSE